MAADSSDKAPVLLTGNGAQINAETIDGMIPAVEAARLCRVHPSTPGHWARCFCVYLDRPVRSEYRRDFDRAGIPHRLLFLSQADVEVVRNARAKNGRRAPSATMIAGTKAARQCGVHLSTVHSWTRKFCVHLNRLMESEYHLERDRRGIPHKVLYVSRADVKTVCDARAKSARRNRQRKMISTRQAARLCRVHPFTVWYWHRHNCRWLGRPIKGGIRHQADQRGRVQAIVVVSIADIRRVCKARRLAAPPHYSDVEMIHTAVAAELLGIDPATVHRWARRSCPWIGRPIAHEYRRAPNRHGAVSPLLFVSRAEIEQVRAIVPPGWPSASSWVVDSGIETRFRRAQPVGGNGSATPTPEAPPAAAVGAAAGDGPAKPKRAGKKRGRKPDPAIQARNAKAAKALRGGLSIDAACERFGISAAHARVLKCRGT